MMEGNEVDQHSEIDTRNETNLLSDLSNSHYAK